MKSKLVVGLIILSVIFGITTVSAGDNQTEIISDTSANQIRMNQINNI